MGLYQATWRFFLIAYSLNVIQDLFSVGHQVVRARQAAHGVDWRPCAVVRCYMALSLGQLLPIACTRPCCSQNTALFYLHSWLNDHADVISCNLVQTRFYRSDLRSLKSNVWRITRQNYVGGASKVPVVIDPLLIGLVFKNKAKNVKCQSYGAIKKVSTTKIIMPVNISG